MQFVHLLFAAHALPLEDLTELKSRLASIAAHRPKDAPSGKVTSPPREPSHLLKNIYGGDHILLESTRGAQSSKSDMPVFASHYVPNLETHRQPDKEIYACGSKYAKEIKETDACQY